MSARLSRIVILIAGIILAGYGLLRYHYVGRWGWARTATIAFLEAARAGDTASLVAMAPALEVRQRALTLARQEPAGLDTLIASLQVVAGSQKQDGFIVHFRTRTAFCRPWNGVADEFQVSGRRVNGRVQFSYAGITPC